MSFLTHPEPDTHLKGDELGRTYTPEPVARGIVEQLARRGYLTTAEGGPIRTAWEPCVGGGAFPRAIRAVVRSPVVILGYDLDEKAPGWVDCNTFMVRDARDGHRGPRPVVDLAITNPPFGLEVGQEVTEAIVAAVRRAAFVSVLLMPVDYLTQAGFEHHVDEAAEIWPMLPRPFPCDRGMATYVWDQRHLGPREATALRALRWRVT